MLGTTVEEIRLFDEMTWQVIKILLHDDSRKWQRLANLKSAPNNRHFVRPLFSYRLHVTNAIYDICFKVIIGPVTSGECTCHE